jgi:hypothetical protein
MPLRIVEHTTGISSPADIKENFLIFFSSVVNGKLWCPDCEAVNDLIQETFGVADGPSALIVHVGEKAEWKSLSNKFRGAPWNIQSVPTIIRINNSKEDGRLVDREIHDHLASFVLQSSESKPTPPTGDS